MAGEEVQAFLLLGSLQNTFQGMINHQSKAGVKHPLTNLLMMIMKLPKAMEKKQIAARHRHLHSSIMIQVSSYTCIMGYSGILSPIPLFIGTPKVWPLVDTV